MAFKLVVVALLVTIVCAQNEQQKNAAEEYENSPSYEYSYSVQDSLTGDNKRQQETRRGNDVRGSYSLVDPDGTRRVVEYRADDDAGFRADVRRERIDDSIQQQLRQLQQIQQQIQEQQIQEQQIQQQRLELTRASNEQEDRSQQQQQQLNGSSQTQSQSQTQTQTIQRIEVPVFQAIPRTILTVQDLIAPSLTTVRRVNGQQDQQQSANQQQETRVQARLSFRSPGLSYTY